MFTPLETIQKIKNEYLRKMMIGFSVAGLDMASESEINHRVENLESNAPMLTDKKLEELGNTVAELFTIDNFAKETVDVLENLCMKFARLNEHDITLYQPKSNQYKPLVDWEQVGMDLYLTMNGHVVGFWSRFYEADPDMRTMYREPGDRLTASCSNNEIDFVLGDDQKIYLEGQSEFVKSTDS